MFHIEHLDTFLQSCGLRFFVQERLYEQSRDSSVKLYIIVSAPVS
jgi:hypothetical protein